MNVTDVHAILLIGLPLVVAILLSKLGGRSPDQRDMLFAAFGCVAGMAACVVCNNHMCDEGTPRNQWLIGGACLLAVLSWVKANRWRRLLGVVVFVAMFGLSCQFTNLVHAPGWTGNRSSNDRLRSAQFGSFRRTLQITATDTGNLGAEFPAGWLRDLPLSDQIERLIRDWPAAAARRVIRHAWHTWLTGLYPYDAVKQDYWYPGGSLADSTSKIELRDRPEP